MKNINIDDLILNYNPEHIQERFRQAIEPTMVANPLALLPTTVPWPASGKPLGAPLQHSPDESEDLTKFRGYDAVIVTWTAAEAAALAALLTPGFRTLEWYEYRHKVENYIPLVTGPLAPFNAKGDDMKRYFHSMGLYFPCTIGNKKVLLFKSGLHLAYDGPATPVAKLMEEIVTAVKPKVLITTGTGGGIGSDVLLGDVVVAGEVRFDCTTKFKDKPWKNAIYKTSHFTKAAADAITPALTKVNGAKVQNGRAVPKIWTGTKSAIVTTDFFAFDDSTNFYKLQGLGKACDMGDAMVAQVLVKYPDIKFFAIRNASDPQMPNPNNKILEADHEAGVIYSKFGGLTTAASVIASWAIVHAHTNS